MAAKTTQEPESLGTFGVATDEQLAQLDLPPIPFKLTGYKKTTKAPVEYLFHVKPTMEFGPLFVALQSAGEEGEIPPAVAAKFIGDCIVAEDRDEFMKTLRRPDEYFTAELIAEITSALVERYGLVPTRPRSVRRSGPRRTTSGRTTARKRSSLASV